MDKKTIIRNFKEKMSNKFGKSAEDIIYQKVYKLLNVQNLTDEELNKTEKEIEETLTSGKS